MAEMLDNVTTEAPPETDVVAAVQRVLAASPEPLTLPKIRSQLPARTRAANLEDVLQRQVAARVLYQFPRYRSQQDRFWDRPMDVHVQVLLEETLRERPLGLSELRRKLPAYAQGQAESALEEQLRQGQIHRHPRTGRGSERFGVRPPDPKDYLREEFIDVFDRLTKLGFTQEQLRAGALELLHEDEWGSPRREQPEQPTAPDQPPAAEAPRTEHEPSQPMPQQF
jgi:hypothetical protein